MVRLIVIMLICIMWYNVSKMQDSEQKNVTEKNYMFFIGIILIALAAFRGGVGDTGSYVFNYDYLRYQSIREVFVERFGIGTGYHVLSKIFSLTGLGVMWWFATLESLYLICVYLFIDRFSHDRLFSVLCFFTMGLYMFSLAGLKQTMAMGLSMLGYICFFDKKYIKSAILFFLAFWCHTATIAFFFGVILCVCRKMKNLYYIVFISMVIIVILWSNIWEYSIGMLNDYHYQMYAEADNIYTAWTFIFYVLLFAITLVMHKSYGQYDQAEANLLYSMGVMVMFFQSLATSYSTAFRIAYFYQPFMWILMPNCCEYTTNHVQKKYFKFILAGIVIFWDLYTSRNMPFPFFWDGYGI